MSRVITTIAALALFALAARPASAQAVNPAPTQKDWSAIADLPDLSGVWIPRPLAPKDGYYVPQDNLPEWKPQAAQRVQSMLAADRAGRPRNIFVDCLPEGMPSYVLMTLNAMEVLVTPGRITILGEFDGNRTRRIYTDGRPHPEDPDLTFNGHSIGRWDGGVLVVDTVGILPQAYIALGQSLGVPNNGDMRLVERIRLVGPDVLQDEIEITAPKVLAKPWRFTRLFDRHRERSFDIIEASCRQGDFTSAVDADGFAVFQPLAREQGGAPVPTAPAGSR